MLVSYLVHSSTLKMESICFLERTLTFTGLQDILVKTKLFIASAWRYSNPTDGLSLWWEILLQAISDILSPKHPADVISFMGFFIRATVTTLALDSRRGDTYMGCGGCFLSPKDREAIRYYVIPKEARSCRLKLNSAAWKNLTSAFHLARTQQIQYTVYIPSLEATTWAVEKRNILFSLWEITR